LSWGDSFSCHLTSWFFSFHAENVFNFRIKMRVVVFFWVYEKMILFNSSDSDVETQVYSVSTYKKSVGSVWLSQCIANSFSLGERDYQSCICTTTTDTRFWDAYLWIYLRFQIVLFFFFFFCTTEVWPLGSDLLARCSTSPFCFSYFPDRVSCFCLGCPWTMILRLTASYIAGTIDEMGVFLTFFLKLISNHQLQGLCLSSRMGSIIGMHHHITLDCTFWIH
jgi:hypothetical protein